VGVNPGNISVGFGKPPRRWQFGALVPVLGGGRGRGAKFRHGEHHHQGTGILRFQLKVEPHDAGGTIRPDGIPLQRQLTWPAQDHQHPKPSGSVH